MGEDIEKKIKNKKTKKKNKNKNKTKQKGRYWEKLEEQKNCWRKPLGVKKDVILNNSS